MVESNQIMKLDSETDEHLIFLIFLFLLKMELYADRIWQSIDEIET